MTELGLRIHQVATIANATSQDVATERVDEGRCWRVERFGFRDRTSSPTRVEVLISRGGDEYHVGDEGTPTANRIYWDGEPITLYEREQLVFRFVGATLADIVDAWVIGQEVIP
jgi:hypothetical protein